MKKIIILLMLAVTGIQLSKAQRMLPKQKGLEISGGLLSKEISKNYYLSLTLTVNSNNGSYWLWRGEYTHQFSDYRSLQVPFETYTGEIGYSVKMLSNAKKSIALNMGLSALAGYETINRGDSLLYDGAKILSKDNLIYGAGLDFSLETYLSDHFVLLLHGRTKILWGTDLKQFRPSTGFGIRYNF